MKAYLSYCTSGYYNNRPDPFVLDLTKICVCYLQHNFGEVHMITDSASKPHFEGIAFDSITTELDAVPKEYPEAWSLSKLFAYREIARRGDPFVHTDYDAVLWQGLPERLLKADIFAQSYENVFDWRYDPEKFYRNCPNRYVFNECFPIKAVNVGIFGGKNLGFVDWYSNEGIKLVTDPANRWFWQEYKGFEMHWSKAVIAEQMLLAACAGVSGTKIEVLFDHFLPQRKGAETRATEDRKPYTHLMGKKSDQSVRDAVAKMARRVVRVKRKMVNLGFDHQKTEVP